MNRSSRRAPKAQLNSQNRLARTIYESLEARLVLSAMTFTVTDTGDTGPSSLQAVITASTKTLAKPTIHASTTVYTESNNPSRGLNVVLAFHQNTNGTLSPIGSYNTGGTGQTNILSSIGPSDSSFEVIATPDGRFVVAVNMGSSSVSTFRVNNDGGLTLVGTFGSGGVQPDSLAITGDKLYVTNRADSSFNPATGVLTMGTATPNITGFQILGDGTLKPIAGSTVSFSRGTSPSHSLITPDGKLLFVDNFAVPKVAAADGNTMIPFQIKGNGQLVEGSPVRAPVTPPQLLGATLNPTKQIIYGGLALAKGVAVFTYTTSGVITYVGETPITGVVPCWGAASADGKYLYTGNTASDTVTVLSLADPLHPVQIQDFALGGPTPPSGSTTRAFQVQLSPDGHTLFAISSGNPVGANPNGNQLHDLVVAANGTLSEPVGPAVLALNGVPGEALDLGIALVVRATGQPVVTGFELTNPATQAVLGQLTNGEVISLSALHVSSVDVADISSPAALSTTFDVNGVYVGMSSAVVQTLLSAENSKTGLGIGKYTVIAQAFSGKYATGIGSAFAPISFQIVA